MPAGPSARPPSFGRVWAPWDDKPRGFRLSFPSGGDRPQVLRPFSPGRGRAAPGFGPFAAASGRRNLGGLCASRPSRVRFRPFRHCAGLRGPDSETPRVCLLCHLAAGACFLASTPRREKQHTLFRRIPSGMAPFQHCHLPKMPLPLSPPVVTPPSGRSRHRAVARRSSRCRTAVGAGAPLRPA
jgi:hypothetical protein